MRESERSVPEAAEKLARLREAFPEALVDGRIDLERLAAALGPAAWPAPYGLGWPGKAESLAEAEAPALRRLVEEPAIGAADGPHRFVTGDNLEVLKLLRGELAGQIKLIYIDPPYNTGQGLRYPDNFRLGRRDYLAQSGRPESESAGRLHAPWLAMMAPRLRLAREFLREDGVIFASIDDHEVHHLRLLLDEAFGAENFVSTIVWRKKVVRGRGARHVLPQTEYVHVYAKKLAALPAFSEPLTEAMRAEYTQADAKGPYKLIPLAKSGTSHSPRPNLVYPITAPDGTAIACPTHQWRWSQETLAANMDEIVFKQTRQGAWRVYTKQRLMLEAGERERTPISYYDRATTTDGTAELKGHFGEVVIDFPKPTRLIRDLIAWATPRGGQGGDWVLDFFAGSCPTAEAVLALNAEDGGDRRFLCVQLPEPTDHPDYPTIAAIGRARIEKVIARAADPALGCRVFRLE